MEHDLKNFFELYSEKSINFCLKISDFVFDLEKAVMVNYQMVVFSWETNSI